MKTSPGAIGPPSDRMCLTVSPIAPRCTGICGAFTTSWPVAEKIAQLKSRRSFTFVEMAVRSSVVPICSAIEANRLLKISSWIGSTSVERSDVCGRWTSVSSSSPRASSRAGIRDRPQRSRSARRRWPGRRIRRRVAGRRGETRALPGSGRRRSRRSSSARAQRRGTVSATGSSVAGSAPTTSTRAAVTSIGRPA